MMYSADNLNLCLELTLSLATSISQLLNGNFCAIWQHSFVNKPKTTLPEKISIGEFIGRHRQLFVSKSAFREAEGVAKR